MYRIMAALLEIGAASVFLVPIFLLYGRFVFRRIDKTLAYLVFGCYLVAVLALVGFPDVLDLTVDVTINALPLVGMLGDFKNACLNVLLFVPLGFFLPVCWDRFRSIRQTAMAGLAVTCLIEAAQLFTFRATDINDVITNVVGTLVGFWITKLLTKDFSRWILPDSKYQELYLIGGAVLTVMLFAQPFASAWLWELIL